MTLEIQSPVIDELIAHNAQFARTDHVAGLPLLPRNRTTVLSCVDPRVDPALIMGMRLGDAAVIRNIGGRVTPAALRTLALLGVLARAGGTPPGPGWNLVVVHHTDCGIVHLLDYPDALAAELDVAPEQLDRDTISDPRRSLAADLAALHANPFLPAGLIVSGLLYDVDNGRLETVVPPSALGSA